MKYLTILGVCIAVLMGCKNKTTHEKHAENQAEPTSLKTYSNGKLSVKSYDFDNLERFITIQNDTTYVVNFWATWCAPCVEELPYFEQANEQFSNQKVKFVMVNLDFPKHIESRLLPFMEENDMKTFVVILNDTDANRWIPKVEPDWEGNIPITIIHKNNQRAFYDYPFENEQMLVDEINKFVNN